MILDQTPFYAESGGQVGDKGELKGAGFSFAVSDTQKYGQAIGHIGKVASGSLKVGDAVQADVDEARRQRIRLNHSATHLMHAALRQVLGTHVAQKGSLVNDKALRFDFSHFEAMKPEEIRAVEDLVNAQIRRNLAIETNIMDIDAARASGAMALFGEKYDDRVRVLRMGDFSTELCGGDSRGAYRRYRPVPHHVRVRHRCWRAPYRSGDWRRRDGHPACAERSAQ
ncbi:alanyl-tRNA synthetase [Klebsiella pneumoniae]|uniref:Alanine--tRNA ligase n=1 Tax=Klebsiella pneumoniae TaxID=573 RepID=A0A2X3I327_KLEPN|nr:alanyl-tRNA synthetase [Klebsiella pneumoniae]